MTASIEASPASDDMADSSPSRLKRQRYPMPAFVRKALKEQHLMDAYRARPPYQQNDYIGWITRAKRPETQEKRLKQMLEELARGNVYMKMVWRPRKSD